jgi:hypothetical protein
MLLDMESSVFWDETPCFLMKVAGLLAASFVLVS